MNTHRAPDSPTTPDPSEPSASVAPEASDTTTWAPSRTSLYPSSGWQGEPGVLASLTAATLMTDTCPETPNVCTAGVVVTVAVTVTVAGPATAALVVPSLPQPASARTASDAAALVLPLDTRAQ